MARKSNQENLDDLRDAIIEYPEQKAGWFARLLGRDNKSVLRDLPHLEERGDLLVEDDDGHISWYGRKK
jgi:predicted transcriptional regulator